MNRFIAWVKEHPYKSAGIVVAIGAVYILLKNRSSGTAATTDDSSAYLNAEAAAVQAGSQFQVAQLQANQAALQSNNQAAVANNQITGQEVVAQLQSQDTLAGIAAQATTQQNADTLSAQTTQAVSLLQAQVAENQTNQQTAQEQIAANAEVQIASLPYDSVTPQLYAQLNANTANIATINTNVSQIGNDLAHEAQGLPNPTPVVQLQGYTP